jgi:hypothetical protein
MFSYTRQSCVIDCRRHGVIGTCAVEDNASKTHVEMRLDLSHISRGPRLDQRHLRSLTQPIHMTSGICRVSHDSHTHPTSLMRRSSLCHAPRLSRAFSTSPKPLIHSISFIASLTFPCLAWIFMPEDGLKCRADAAATSDLLFEMSGLRKRNWRLRFDRSIVSRSICECQSAFAV